MASNSFGKIFRFTTFGESHGSAIGAVIDGCPAGYELSNEDINAALFLRAPGNSPYTSPRKEPDEAEILSGVFQGKTTGAPIAVVIQNKDAKASSYDSIKDYLRPGHANFTYLEKYGVFDDRGGGRASGRETASRVIAGVIAKKILQDAQIEVIAYIQAIGPIIAENLNPLLRGVSPIFCPDPVKEVQMLSCLEKAIQEGDSLGGVVEFLATGLPLGLGDPVYDKLEARLAFAMMGIPGTKGFEIGSGFEGAKMLGSLHNDLFEEEGGRVKTKTNYAGGTLGGISTGMPLIGRVAFKPTSSISKPQMTLNLKKEPMRLTMPKNGRHDPCIAIRGVFVVEAMLAVTLADALLSNRVARR